jgi:ribosomal protein S18 acetylase RimI-like enzyme
MEIKPRIAVMADEKGIISCIEAAYSKYIERISKKPEPMGTDYKPLIRQKVVYVFEDSYEIIAVIVLIRKKNYMYIDNLAVRPGHQGKGIGKALIKFAENEAFRNGLKEVRLFTNVLMKENIEIYSRLGYKETERRIEKGYNRVFMSKVLGN